MELKTVTPQKLFVFSLIIALLLALPIAVKAESGTVSWQSLISTSKTPGFGEYNGGFSPDWTKIDFDNTDYNTISNLTYNGTGGLVYAQQSNWTSFIITSGGSGTGLVTYSKYLDHIQWLFSSDTVISGSPIVLTYSYPNFFNDISVNCGVLPSFGGTATGVSASFPAGIETTAGGRRVIASEGTGCDFPATYTSRVGQNVQNSYNITYSTVGGTQFFATNLTKPVSSVSAATKDKIESATIIYEQEATFNNNAFTNFLDQQKDGIYLNVTVSSGDFRKVLINSSGTPAGPTPPAGGQFNPPLTIPSSGGSIQFNQTKYVVGDTVRVEWAVSNTEWNCIVCNRQIITITDDKGNLIEDRMDAPTQTGSKTYKATSSGIWTAQLIERFFTDTIVSTASTTIQAEQTSTLIVPSSVPVGKNFSVTYMYGFTPFVQTYANGVYAVDLNGAIKGFVSNPSVAALQSYTINMTVPSAGTYTIQLKDFSKGVVATAQTSATLVFVPPTLNITTSYLTLDSSSYNLGDLVSASYGIDNTNYSNYNIYYRVSNYTTGNIFNHQMPAAQQGTFNFNTYDGIDQFDLSNYQIPSGINRVAIRASNSSSDFEIAFANFTFSRLNLRGYKLEMTKHGSVQICTGETIYAKVTIPAESTTVNILVSNTGKLIYSANYSNTTTIPIKITSPDVYLIDVISNSDNVVQVLDAFTISDCAAGTPTVGVTAPGEGWGLPTDQNSISHTVSQLDGYVGTMGYGVNNTTRFMFSVVVIILFIVFVLLATKGNGTVALATGFLPFSFFTLISFDSGAQAAGIEFIPKWPAIMFIILVALAVKVLR